MTFAIVGGGQLDTGYTIDNSCRFNDNEGDYLYRTPGSAGNRKTYTFSTWVKRSTLTTNINPLFECFLNANQWTALSFGTNNKLRFYHVDSGTDYGYETNMIFRDTSSWYHIVVALDTTQATAANRMILYVNGNETTFDQNYGEFPQNDNTWINSTNQHTVGKYSDQTKYFDGYLAETHFIDGQQLDASSFGEFDADSGIWKPIQYTGSYGTNGFFLEYQNTGDAGEDSSGNGNNFTGDGGLDGTNIVQDSPTNNFATFNAVFRNNTTNFTQPSTLSEGNLRATGVNTEGNISTIGLNAGKWYWEAKIVTRVSNDLNFNILSIDGGGDDVFRTVTWQSQGDLYIDNSLYDTSFTTFSSGDIIACALDLDAATPAFKLYKNGAEQGSGFTFNASNRDDEGASIFIGVGIENTSDDAQYNFGCPPFTISSGNSDDNGYGNFEYAPPSGYLALCTQNLATALSPAIDNSSQYFNTVLYTGNGSTNNITGVGFQPDWVWGKCRSAAQASRLFDSSRGVLKNIISSATNAEATTANSLTSFDSDGFTLGSDDNLNFNTRTFVAWNWKANGGSTSSNTDGAITTTVQADTTAGFSIVTFDLNSTSPTTFGHGLTKAPEAMFIKNRDNANNWDVYFFTANYPTAANGRLKLNSADSYNNTSGVFNNTLPTSSVVTINSSWWTGGTDSLVAYCFHSVEGYSKIGKWSGNGNSDGTFVYTGFKPAFLLLKQWDNTRNWVMWDNKRDPDNLVIQNLFPNASDGDDSTGACDFLSNGFKLRNTNNTWNGSGFPYVFIAFAENPFVSSTGVAGLAR